MVNSKEISKIFNKFWNRWESFKIYRNFMQSYLTHLWGTTLAWSEVLASGGTKNASAQVLCSRMSGMVWPPVLFFEQIEWIQRIDFHVII